MTKPEPSLSEGDGEISNETLQRMASLPSDWQLAKMAKELLALRAPRKEQTDSEAFANAQAGLGAGFDGDPGDVAAALAASPNGGPEERDAAVRAGAQALLTAINNRHLNSGAIPTRKAKLEDCAEDGRAILLGDAHSVIAAYEAALASHEQDKPV